MQAGLPVPELTIPTSQKWCHQESRLPRRSSRAKNDTVASSRVLRGWMEQRKNCITVGKNEGIRTALNHYNISYLCLRVTGNILLTFMKSSLKCWLPLAGLRKVTGSSERCHHFVFNLTPVRVPLTFSHAEVTVLQRTSNSVRAVVCFILRAQLVV